MSFMANMDIQCDGGNLVPTDASHITMFEELLPVPPPNIPPPQTADSTYKERVKNFWISIPPLDPSEMAKYKSMPSDMEAMQLDSDGEHTPVEILGEIRLGTDPYYWVVYENDVVYRVGNRVFTIIIFDASWSYSFLSSHSGKLILTLSACMVCFFIFHV
jgi:hypothetical protein